MKILLIEDEIPAARRLGDLLKALRDNITVMDTLDSVEGAVRWLNTFPDPDLIFMDIQIADGLSFDIFQRVDVKSPVIFTTAYDHYAVQAFKVNAVDYLLKPIDSEELNLALQKTEQQRLNQIPLDWPKLFQWFKKTPYKDRFLVKTGQYMNFLPVADIAYFRSSDGLTQAYSTLGKKFIIDHTLEELEQLLDPAHFFRVSRNLLLKLNAIHKIHTHLNGRLKLEILPALPEDCFVSRERVADFKSWLGG